MINLYATSGRNAGSAGGAKDGAIELTPSNKWYSPVPARDRDRDLDSEPATPHVIGDDDEA